MSLLPSDEEQRAPVRVREDAHVLQDLVAEAPDLQLVADVLDELEDELALVQLQQLPPAPPPRPAPLMPLLQGRGQGEEGGMAFGGGVHDGPKDGSEKRGIDMSLTISSEDR